MDEPYKTELEEFIVDYDNTPSSLTESDFNNIELDVSLSADQKTQERILILAISDLKLPCKIGKIKN